MFEPDTDFQEEEEEYELLLQGCLQNGALELSFVSTMLSFGGLI